MTEAGDAEQDLGYLVDEGLRPSTVHYPAVDIDRSEWDDPDYQLLAFRGRDHPFGPARAGPTPARPRTGRPLGTAVRTVASTSSGRPCARCARTSRTWASRSTRSPGSTSASTPSASPSGPGYLYRGRAGAESRRPALSFDMRGHELPQLT